MKESRVSQLLMQSRSRHSIVQNPELKRISREWQIQKRQSKESNDELKRMLREMRYYEKVNHKLANELSKGKSRLKEAEFVHSRHIEDKQKKQELDNLRLNLMMQNHEKAKKIKGDRQKKLTAIQRNIYMKKSLGENMRSESRRLTEQREQNYLEDYTKNRSRIQNILQFEADSREKSIKKREKSLMEHLKKHEKNIESQKQTIKLRERQSVSLKQKIRTLTQNSSRKQNQLETISNSIQKYSSPYTPSYLSINQSRYKKHKNHRHHTQKIYQDSTQQESSVFVSQHYYSKND